MSTDNTAKCVLAHKLIIALVPTKNEEHIIEAFIRATLLVADRIIIVDQRSADATPALASKYPHVHVVPNKSDDYNEHARQQLLIATARELYGVGNVLLAIDTDEFFLPFDANPATVREALLAIDEGTTLLFDKPTLVSGESHWIRYGPVFPLGYVDDGASHQGSCIHSRRVPGTEDGRTLQVTGCAFVHLDLYDMEAHLAKRRYYAALERINGHKNITIWRRSSRFFIREQLKNATPASPSWQLWFMSHEIDFRQLRRPQPYWWDVEIVKLMSKYGCKLFWWDDIWYVSYRRIIDDAISRNLLDAKFTLQRPPFHVAMLRSLAILMLYSLYVTRSTLRSLWAAKLH